MNIVPLRRSQLESRHLDAILAIAEEGTVTRAAARLRVTQPALSRQLLEIEARLGVRLFQRTARAMRPTEPGARLTVIAREVLERLAVAEEEVTGGARAILRLSTQCFTTYRWLP